MIDLRKEKRALRAVMQEKRGQASGQAFQAAAGLRDQFLKHVKLPASCVVASFMPVGSEIDVQPLTESLRAQGHVIVLPVVAGKGLPLVFRRHESGDALQKSPFGLHEPLEQAPAFDPAVVLVPMLAFDRAYYRLGYGGGYYDRTLDLLRHRAPLIAAGVAFACQEVVNVPRGVHDARLDKIVTENEAF